MSSSAQPVVDLSSQNANWTATTPTESANGSSLEDFKITSAELPSSFYYISNFLPKADQTTLLQQIQSHPWIELSHRRLQVYPAQLTANNVLLSSNGLPSWLKAALDDRFTSLGVFEGTVHGAMNHVLVNNYKPGEGIMAHEDGPAYSAVTATVSLGGTCVLNLYDKSQSTACADIDTKTHEPKWRILQEPGSLLVTRGPAAYTGTLHEIEPLVTDEALKAANVANWAMLAGDTQARIRDGRLERLERTSLTCRDVIKVSKLGNKILGLRGVR